jgi:Zn-dependent M28 family amino/carboxypeptidase
VVLGEALARADREIIADIWTSEAAYENLVTLCDDCGSRFGGTPGERLAVDFMVKKLREYGLDNVREEAFTYHGWARGTARLESIQPSAASFDCIGLPYCGTADIQGELVFLGHGAPEDYAKKREQIKGNIVMVSTQSPSQVRRPMHRMEKYGRALEAGAAGFIWMREEPGLLPETGSIRFNAEAEIPGVGVSREVGAALQRLGKKGPVKLRMITSNVNQPMTSWNVVGEIRGHTHPDRYLVMGAHFDGHDISQGALDDGAGAVVAMEACRALAKHKELLPKSVKVILFPVEEIGLIGSHAYVDAHLPEMKDCEFMLNLDGAGRPGDTNLVLQGFGELQDVFEKMCREMKHPLTITNRISTYSDMYPFVLEGVPSATMMSVSGGPRAGRGWGHTAADTLDKVSPRALQMDALTTARMVLRLANLTGDWPVPHKTRGQIKELLEAEGLIEVLKFERRYAFEE